MKGLARAKSLRRRLDLGDLAGPKEPRHIGPGEQSGLARVAAKHASKAPGALLRALAAMIRRRIGIGVGGKIAGQTPDIGHGGEALRGDPLPAAAKRCFPGDSHDRRTHHPGIDELALGQPLAVGEGADCGPRPFERDEVGGCRAHINQQAIGAARRRQRGARVPVGRSHVGPALYRLVRIEKAGAGAIEEGAIAGCLAHQPHEIGHALRAAGKDVGKLPGHGDCVGGARRTARQRLGEGAIELVRAGQERAGGQGRRHDGPFLDMRQFEVGATQIPPDH